MNLSKDNIITLSHGNGGEMMDKLISELFIKTFDNPQLSLRNDQARFPLNELQTYGQELAFTTDSYVISPLFFPGGDIGKLAVCGTINDLVVGGATPLYLSCGFIIEEGLAYSTLEKIVISMAETAKQAGVAIVTGDTKVVPKGCADKLFINTSGIGVIPKGIHWSPNNIKENDMLIISGTLGDHGATILNLREDLGLSGELKSDCAPLTELLSPLKQIPGVKTVRDATRGGVNAILHEFAHASGFGCLIDEKQLPLSAEVRGMCELLGLDPINFANEGKVVIACSPESANEVLSCLHQHPLGKKAAIIGQMTDQSHVMIQGHYGIKRQLMRPHHDPLPRIC